MKAIEKISDNVKSLLCASNQINNFTVAVQELVYNCIDAEATSIAVRIHIEEGNIQVIDNGYGIRKNDFELLGQNYMTSKLADIATLKSMPDKYGFRGQSLANIVQVSKCVKITSRSGKSEETFTKIFEFGKEKHVLKSKTRPSKGTTVEIKGFLYNLTIQKKCSNYLTELQYIKSFLQNTSLVHYNISMSLRDDATNDIVFKMHKNGNIYKLLLNVYGIKETDIQELRVEKNQYKVIAYIARQDNESTKQLIFLNGKLLTGDSKLHQEVNNRFSKRIRSYIGKQKKFYDNQEETKNDEIPFYVLLFKCPYFDYSTRVTTKNSTIDFKNWNEIIKLIEKLERFYSGDKILIKKTMYNIEEFNKNKKTDTKDQVKHIINKILGSKPKAPVVSQMHNGVKGKQIKRKLKKTKLTVSKKIDHIINIENNCIPTYDAFPENENPNRTNYKKVSENKPKTSKSKKVLVTPNVKTLVKNSVSKSNLRLKHKHHFNNVRKKLINNYIKKDNNNKKLHAKIALHCKFNIPTNSIKQRYKMLSEEANQLRKEVIPIRKDPKRDIVVKETIKYCNVTENNKNISIRKSINEITIGASLPMSMPMSPHKLNIDAHKQRINNQKYSLLSTYDILKTILTQQNSHTNPSNIPNETELETRNVNHGLHLDDANHFCSSPIVTFKSHNYENRKVGFDHDLFNNCERDNYHLKQNINFYNFCRKSNAFITKKSMDNFVSTNENPNFCLKKKSFRNNFKRNILLNNTLKKSFSKRNFFDLQNKIFNNNEHSSYTIQFSESTDCNLNKYSNDLKTFDSQLSSMRNNKGGLPLANTFNKTPFMINLNKNSDLTYNLYQSSDFLQTSSNVVKNTTVNAYVNEEICVTYEPLKHHGTYTIEDCRYKSDENSMALYHDVESYEPSFNHDTYTAEPQTNIAPENIIKNVNDSIIEMSDDIEPNSQNNGKLISDPIEVCETIFNSRDTLRNEFDIAFNKTTDSFGEVVEEKNTNTTSDERRIEYNIKQDNDDVEPVRVETQKSQHFINSNIIDEKNNDVTNENITTIGKSLLQLENTKNFAEGEGNHNTIMNYGSNFNLQERLGFLPKGMSQIFTNNILKMTCDPNLIKEYYNDNIYKDFANKVQNTVEIFESKIQEASDLTTKDIEKVNIKLKRDNASLKFDGKSLKNSKVVGQVDAKFIAVIVKGNSNNSNKSSEFLVLFDQHAVHERINLETNLTDYFTGKEWNSVKLDEVTLKMSPDDVRFLHNYKGKFAQFGLQWTILSDNEVSLNAIPEAVLGKNPRPAENIVKAVQSLIKEVIHNVKLHSGCVPLYPKSVMDLVFSEACRYAIKFGDLLSKTQCTALIQKLSDCKTPFQCAHGRPVMAVIMDNRPYNPEYMISQFKIREFKKKLASKYMK